MNCWDVLGIEPTQDRATIDEAYEQQRKFASQDDQPLLEKAYRQALSDTDQAPRESLTDVQAAHSAGSPPPANPDSQELSLDSEPRPLTEDDQRVVRETVIQIRALLNDNYRAKEVQIWRAILAEPPSDQAAIRQQIGAALEKEVRPMAENGAFPLDVAHFLADWFGWYSLRDAKPPSVFDEPRHSPASRSEGGDGSDGSEENSEEKPQSVNFWPAAIGWIVGLVILTSLFSGMSGGG